MKKSTLILIVSLSLFICKISAQSNTKIEEATFQIDNLEDPIFTSFSKKMLHNSQFVFIGEQHGIKEVGEFTNAIYNIAREYKYNTLCIETDRTVANIITDIAKLENPLEEAQKINNQFQLAIPFYNNEDDYSLFKNVVKNDGSIWGIDQTFMAQFRLNFDHIIKTTSNKKLKNKLKVLKANAENAFKEVISTRNFNKMYIYQYTSKIHDELMSLSTKESEKEVFRQLLKTKEIYTYNKEKKYYKNNNTRGLLMKYNFSNYYKDAQKNDPIPKVIFKLGGFHAAKGRTRTNIYDIANFASELAIFNRKKSLHFLVYGIQGKAATGNPFTPEPVVSFNNTKQLPKELQGMLPKLTKKYVFINLTSLRPLAGSKRFSEDLKQLIFGYDVIVLVNNAEALKTFK